VTGERLLLPPEVTEQEFLRVVDKLASRMARRFAFGPYSPEDLAQQCVVWALESMDKYDPARPLENFLQVHLKRRLLNLRRNKLKRTEIPCRECHDKGHHGDGVKCDRYLEWESRNLSKLNIMFPLDLAAINEDQERSLQARSGLDSHDVADLLSRIEDRLPPHMRADLLRMADGALVTSERRREIKKAVRSILWEEHCEEER
jgi:DNA-directed RNA polymerase specialized sigma24 family protein